MIPIGGTSVIHALCTGTDCEGELLHHFRQKHIHQRPAVQPSAVFCKDVRKSLSQISCWKEVTSTLEQFDKEFRETFAEYYENHGGKKQSNLEITGRTNKELDDLMGQLLAGA
ncbi:MAG: hypothetical protein ACI4NL_05215 [Christensenellales bacterium]